MIRRLSLITLTTSLLLPIPAIAAEPDFTGPDIDNGRKLHRQACRQCHDDSMYTRQNSIIFSYKALKNRVKFCERMSGARWNDRQLDDVIAWLNHRYYKFKRP